MASQTPRDNLASIAGPASMAKPGPGEGESANAAALNATKKKKNHRGGRRHRKARRQSFIAPSEAATEDTTDLDNRPSLLEASHHASQRDSFYRVQGSTRHGSNTSLESEALLDHREHTPLSRRRDTMRQGFARVAKPFRSHQHRPSDASGKTGAGRSRLAHASHVEESIISEDEEDENAGTERSPLLGGDRARSKPHVSRNNSALHVGTYGSNGHASRARHGSSNSKPSSPRGQPLEILTATRNTQLEGDHDVNNPPSVPGSPTLGGTADVYMHGLGSSMSERGRDAVIHIDEDEDDDRFDSRSPESSRRRMTLAQLAERDVCFPGDDDATEHGEESPHASQRESSAKPRRRRGRRFPDLSVLEEWSREEKEARTQQEVLRAKKISEPVMIGGRLRPAKTVWHREAETDPMRFTYFNEMLDSTIHARTISDLQDDLTFRDLFLPDPPELSDSEDDEEQDYSGMERPALHKHNRSSSDGALKNVDAFSQNGDLPRPPSVARGSIIDSIANSRSAGESTPASGHVSGNATPKAKRKRYGPRPTFWLDVLSPTDSEMNILSKAFGIHQLTSEDILMDEPREKVELFPSYYFVNYRTFEQDKDDAEYMEPINMYVIVFRDGVISFHHSESPHPANVRRRIRQLNDYMSPTADWISYAIIDDITDVYAPLVTEIEQEVDDIDEEILLMHQESDPETEEKSKQDEKQKDKGSKNDRRESNASATTVDAAKKKPSGGDMLRRVGGCRKKVMGLYRLLGNKADVIKGFAKRCNEHWEVAPRSEIGLYLGDIQDHIVTMTGNLSHYESLLSRAHGNYVAQINIRMNERAEKNADVLGKLTVLGTIVLPMNIVTGMWGMNVWVPGQEYEGDLTWFFCITAGLAAFGFGCYFIAKKVYGIV